MTIRIAPGAVKPDRIVRSVCSPNCTGSCGINVHVKDGKMLKVEPAEFPDPRYRRICLKGISMAMQRVDHEGRIRYPMLRKGERGGGSWQRLSWDDAFDYVAGKLDGIAKRYGPESNAWISMTGNYGILSMMLSSRVANSLGGTAFSNLGIMGDLGANMGFLPTLGVHQESNEWPDIVGSKLIILFGKNIADTAHSDIHFMFEAMEKGARVVSIDPRFSRTSTKADQWIPIRPGTDGALMLALCHELIRLGLYDRDFVARYSNAGHLVNIDPDSDSHGMTVGGEGIAHMNPFRQHNQLWWDRHTGKPVVNHSGDSDPQLFGSFRLHDGTPVKPAFQLLAERLDTARILVRLTQLDGALPNLALMKLASWHKARGSCFLHHRRWRCRNHPA
jgi:anaerobic selenocysteine-containing dehydrogenase